MFGTQIAYVSEEKRPDGSKRFRLIVSDADGENAKIVADSPQPLMSPSWSPDARRLAYVSFEGDASQVFVQTLRTGTRERVSARAGVNGSPAFSPDGRLLALTLSQNQGNLDIFTLDLTTQVLRQLTTDAAIDTEAAWSPDGRQIYFLSDRSGGPQIYRVGAEPGARAERVTYEGVYNARPRISPDGKQIAVVYGQNNTYRIGVVNASSGVLDVLTDRPARRIAELRPERRAAHLRDARRRTRRARVRHDRRQRHSAGDRICRRRRPRTRLGPVPAALTPSDCVDVFL